MQLTRYLLYLVLGFVLVLGIGTCQSHASPISKYESIMQATGWECRVVLDDTNCIVKLPPGLPPLRDAVTKEVVEMGGGDYILSYDCTSVVYDMIVHKEHGVLEPLMLVVLSAKPVAYAFELTEDGLYVCTRSDMRQFRKPMFAPKGFIFDQYLQTRTTRTPYLHYIVFSGRGPMKSDKETIESMPLMLMLLVDDERAATIGLVAVAQCTRDGKPMTLCNYYVVGAGGYVEVDKAGMEAVIEAYKEKRL